MHERHMHDARYRPLKDYVSRRGGVRLAMHGPLRDQLVEYAVNDFPLDAPVDTGEEVLAARLRLRVRQKYGGVMVFVLAGIISNLVARLVWEWWQRRSAHRVLMAGWQSAAREDR